MIEQRAHESVQAASIPATALPWRKRSFLIDIPIFVLGVALLYSVVAMARYWYGPLTPQVEIDLRARALPLYALYSVLRIALAYFLSLLFTLVYGYIAAYNARAERFMVPLLDVLQSIPVLSFLPGVMLAMVALFPRRQLGVELGSILLIFTGQVWNMAFSFYSSLKNIPTEMREAARLYRFSWWQKFTQMELPFSVIGLVWNSMMSVAGGWFFLMACEMFVLGKQEKQRFSLQGAPDIKCAWATLDRPFPSASFPLFSHFCSPFFDPFPEMNRCDPSHIFRVTERISIWPLFADNCHKPGVTQRPDAIDNTSPQVARARST